MGSGGCGAEEKGGGDVVYVVGAGGDELGSVFCDGGVAEVVGC